MFFIALPSTVSKDTIKKIDQYARLRGVLGQCYPIHPSSRVNHALFVGLSWVQVIFAVAGSIMHKLMLRNKT